MKEPSNTCHVLKQWAAINALEAGKTIMLLRKGGIHEQGGKFQVAHNHIVLYPTLYIERSSRPSQPKSIKTHGSLQ